MRVLRVVILLQAGERWTLDALAAQLGVCDRTMRRDLEAIEAAGMALQTWRADGEPTRWSLST